MVAMCRAKLLTQGCDMLAHGECGDRYAAVGYGANYLLEECGERSTRGEHVVYNEDMLTAKSLGAHYAE